VGRPNKFTPERCERFIAAYSTGVPAETAARHAGWAPATWHRIKRGTSPDHVAFREDVVRAETELELRLAGTVTQAAFGSARLALALLERRFSERWGRRAAVLARAGDFQSPEGTPPPGVIVLEPALLEAVVPVLLAARLGPAGAPEALRRVERFALRAPEDGEA